MKQNTTYKQTELGLIPEDWEVKKLGEIIKLGNGKDYKHLNSGNIPVYGTGGIITYVDEYLFNGKSVGIGRKGSIDKPVLLNNKFWTVDTLFYVKEFFNSDVDFIYNSFLKIPWLKYNEATGLPSLSQNIINNIKIPLPPLPEQKAIADCLSTWDVAIEKQSQLIELLTQRKKALMQQLLTGKKRLPGFSEEWKEVKLGDIGEIQTGNTPSKSDSENWDGEYYWCTAEDMKSKYVTNTVQKLTKKGRGLARTVKSNSVLVTCIASIGINAITKVECSFNQQINSITPNENFNVEFIYYLMNNSKENLLKYAGAGALPMLNKNTFSAIKFKFPFLEEQTAIAEILATADRELQLQKEKLAQLQTQKKGLMQVLLTGKKRLIN